MLCSGAGESSAPDSEKEAEMDVLKTETALCCLVCCRFNHNLRIWCFSSMFFVVSLSLTSITHSGSLFAAGTVFTNSRVRTPAQCSLVVSSVLPRPHHHELRVSHPGNTWSVICLSIVAVCFVAVLF